MAQITNLKFLASSVEINLPKKYRIRPRILCETTAANVEISLTYEIDTSDVNLEIRVPNKKYQMSSLSESFQKEVKFDQIQEGEKKDFYLKVTAKLDQDVEHSKIKVIYV